MNRSSLFIYKAKKLIFANSKSIALLLAITLIGLISLNVIINNNNTSPRIGQSYLIYIAFIVLTICSGLICYFAKKNSWRIEKIYLVFGLLLESLYVCLIPVGAIEDEPAHFYRAYQVAEGKIFKDNEFGQREIPDNLHSTIDDKKINGYQWSLDNISIKPSSEYTLDTYYLDNYAPFNYLPQIVGIWIGKIFSIPFVFIVLLARLLNMIFCTLIIYICIKYIPRLKKLLFFIGFLPMTMQLFASVSADGSIICAGIVLITYVLYSRTTKKRKINWKDFTLLLIICLMLTVTKPVYAPLCLMLFWIPKDKFKNNKHKMIFIFGIGILTLICLLGRLILLPYGMQRFGPETTNMQIQFILEQPFEFFTILSRTILIYAQPLTNELLGAKIAWQTVDIYSPYILTFLILFILLCAEISGKIAKSLKIYSIISLILIIILMFIAEFITWTRPEANVISGVQGRYFLPVLLMLPLCFTPNRIIRRKLINPRTLYIIMIFTNVFAVSAIFATHFLYHI